MFSLRDEIKKAEDGRVAIGHFNVSDLATLKAIFNSAHLLKTPVIIGTSEGEADFIGKRIIASAVKSLREEFNFPIFLNSDHTHSFEKIKESVEAGYDAVLFDAGAKSLNENISETKKIVEFVKEFNLRNNKDVLVEGELGYIGSSSVILDRIPEGVSIKEEDLTKIEEAKKFVAETGVDLFSPAVGNIHGMFSNSPNPNLNIQRIKDIKESIGIPMVLHGGSGILQDQFRLAIENGISLIHVNTEIRVAWKRGIDIALLSRPKEIVPYKILPEVVHEIEKVVTDKIKIFYGF